MRLPGGYLVLIFFSVFLCVVIPINGLNDDPYKKPIISNLDTKLDLENDIANTRLAEGPHQGDSLPFKIITNSDNDLKARNKEGPKLTIDSDNTYRQKFQQISKDKNFWDSIRKLDDGTVNNKNNNNGSIVDNPKTKKELEEWQQFMDALFTSVKTKSGLMREFLQSIQNNTSDITQYLDDLQDLLHDGDLAVDFHYYNGYEFFMNKIKTTLQQLLDDPSQDLSDDPNRAILDKCVRIFVSSAQNNEKVKDILMKLEYNKFLLGIVESIFDQNSFKVELFDSFLQRVTLAMETFLIGCPKCAIDFLSNSHYNHMFKKLLSLPTNTKTWTSTVILLKGLLKEREAILIEDDEEYVAQLKSMSDILDRTLINDDSICEVFTASLEDFIASRHKEDTTLNQLINSLRRWIALSNNNALNFQKVADLIDLLQGRLCPEMTSNESVVEFLSLRST